MKVNNLIKLLSSSGEILQNSGKIITGKCESFIEDNLLKGKYVTREEFEEFQQIIVRLQKQLSEIIIDNAKNKS